MNNQTSSADSSFQHARHPDADAQGQAALLLIESLIHSLLDNGALTKAQAMEAIESAMQVKEESAAEAKEAAQTLRKSLNLLMAMRCSIDAHSGLYHPAVDAAPQGH